MKSMVDVLDMEERRSKYFSNGTEKAVAVLDRLPRNKLISISCSQFFRSVLHFTGMNAIEIDDVKHEWVSSHWDARTWGAAVTKI